jgi:hypothetical protein
MGSARPYETLSPRPQVADAVEQEAGQTWLGRVDYEGIMVHGHRFLAVGM